MEVYHGLTSETGWKWGLKDCDKILLPYNYIIDKKIPRYILRELARKDWILDSGSARYFLNNSYPEYPFSINEYIRFVDEWMPSFFVSLDYATEKFPHWDWVDRTIEKNFILFDEWITNELESDFLPVIQGFSPTSYVYSVGELKGLISSVRRFAIGSVCRATPKKLDSILKALTNIVDLSKAHLFGQTISTIPVVKKYNVGFIDTANATTNAAYKVINTMDGKWLFSKKSNRKQRHNLDHLSYKEFFEINKTNIESLSG